MQLKPVIELSEATFRPTDAPLARVRAKLAAGQPITMVTMGDSLTDIRHWNRKTNWPLFAANAIKEKWHVTTTLINPAIGGTELQQNIVLIPRWVPTTPAPDIVTIFFALMIIAVACAVTRFRPPWSTRFAVSAN